MDPVSALSLAASVITVISFSREVFNICNDLIETGSVSQHRATEESTQNLGSYLASSRSGSPTKQLVQKLPLMHCTTLCK